MGQPSGRTTNARHVPRPCGAAGRRSKYGQSPGRRFEPLEPRVVLDAGPLLINELMAINDDTLADVDGDFNDWIEIYNPTDAAVNLDGWYLTDEETDLTKWQFPDVAMAGGDYLVVFASDKDRAVAGGQLHTNFKLDGDGEFLALVQDDGLTISHQYTPEFPRQVEDVSYGLPSASSAWETLVPVGTPAVYHVPAAGEDPLAWTAPGYDDSAWVDSFTVDAAELLVTEICTGDTRMVEIENVSDQSVNTTGWSVLVNNASGGIDAVGNVGWSLPGSVASGQVLYKTDDAGDNYWGSPINWEPEGPGWVMIIDDAGEVRDFAAWGYSAAAIAGMSVDFGPFAGITVGGEWSGDGAAVGTLDPGGPADAAFVAFNDHIRGAGTHADATTYTPNGTPSGLLKDIDSGLFTGVTLTTSQNGVNWEGTHRNPAAGTDAYNTFNGYVDFSGSSGSGSSIAISGGDHYTHTFSGLDTGDAVTYSFAGTTVRGGGYDDRWTLVTLEGAEAATAAHTSGIGVVVIAPDQVAIWTGENNGSSQGFVARWNDVDPGPDGRFSIVSNQYTGPTPGVGTGTAGGSKGYGISGIRLEELAPVGPMAWLERTGGFDTDTAADFVRHTQSSQGTQNPELSVPFGSVFPVSTGLGFSDNQPQFEALIATDVAAAMEGVNGSLWTRIEFDVVDPAAFDELTLRMKYDDGFAAYLNGVEAARARAPDVLAYDSTATEPQPDEQAVVFEEFGVSGSLDLLQSGSNVLAIHGLNVDAADADMLILPELIATSNLSLPQYMTTPTPDAQNVPGALGLVEDTRFSVDRGFYDAPFQVEITSDTPGAEIRYTTDGNVPTATTGTVYSGPITISQTTTLRAAAYRPGYIATNVDTQTYLFLADVIAEDGAGLPYTWGRSGDGGNIRSPDGPDYAMDAAVVADNMATIHDDLKSVPTVSLVTGLEYWFGAGNPEGIYLRSKSVPTPVSVEFFTADGSEQFQINGSAQIQGGGPGGTSADRWKSYKLSLRLKFKEIYGDAKLRYPLFGDAAADWFDTLILDAQLNHTWIHPGSSQRTTARYIQDQVMADYQNAMGAGMGPHGRFVHLYLNGIYWGMYTLHERPDEHFAAAYFGGEEEEYDVHKHNSSTAINGTTASYSELARRVGRDMTNSSNYLSVLEMLDIDAFIDYMMVNMYAGNGDWAHKNWYASYNKVDPDGKWQFHSWDAEHVLESTSEDRTGESRGPADFHQRLSVNPEYRLRFADRLHKHMHNGGTLSPQGAAAAYQARMTEVDRAIVGESARWGDNRRAGNAYTRANWLATQNSMLSSYFPNRTRYVLEDFTARGLYPSVAAPDYRVNGADQFGGAIDPADDLTMAGSAAIYYTTDGSDPRLYGGGVSGTAVQYAGAINLSESTLLKARVRSGGTWSAVSEAQFYVGTSATAANLVVSEINYHPHDPTPEELAVDPNLLAGDFEFIEIENTSGEPIDLTTVEFSKGITFDFTGSDVSRLDPGATAVLAHNRAALAVRYNTAAMPIAGSYPENLANNGERIRLMDRFGQPIFDFSYDDDSGWPGRADGKGATLELIDPMAVPAAEPLRTEYLQDDDNWHSSVRYGGTPGAEAAPELGVVVNEVLTHTDPPSLDTIELYNTTGASINLAGWYLSDSWGWESNPNNGNYKKFLIPPGASIPAGGYLVFDEADFNPTPLDQQPHHFALDAAHGDDVWLMKADGSGRLTHFADHVDFGASASGESLGRWPNGIGDLYPMTLPTLDKQHPENGQNSGPRVGPLVISELHYNPQPGEDDDDLEFIEIYNSGPAAVNMANWRIRKGIDFDFSAATTLPPGGTLIVVPFGLGDAAKRTAFYNEYWPGGQVPDDLVILGGYSGRLDDDGERVQLQRPDHHPAGEPNYIPRLIEDEVRYFSEAPWPTSAAGLGDSLHRAEVDAWGNSHASWGALPPTPGTTPFDPPVHVEVVGRHVFYNASSFDGGNPAANAQDDDAIAPDKTALLPGGTGTLANYTSFDRGINGLMIDVDGLPAGPGPDADDFQFSVGNTDDTGTWSVLAVMPDVAIRRGAGVAGSDRITLVWPDNLIQKQWLEVTVLATTDTGLDSPDVFYYGNAIGESDNSTTDAKVNAIDMLGARDNQRNFLDPAPIDFPYDFNRDEKVNTIDMLIARNNQTHFLNALGLITPAQGGPKADAAGMLGNVPPVVVGPIADLTVDEDAADVTIDLSTVFDDVDLPQGDRLTFTAEVATPIWTLTDQISRDSYTHIHQDLLYTHLGHDRGIGGKEHDLAVQNILSYFRELGLDAALDPFDYRGTTYYNVVGVKPGLSRPDDIYIVGAHYDSVGNPGADDNASGTAGVMEIARVLAPYDFETTLIFMGFGREEQGLYGSREYAAEHAADNILGMANLDMIAFNPNGPHKNKVALYDYVDGGSVKPDLLDAFARYGRGLVAVDRDHSGASDHQSFEENGFDAALIIEHEVFDNPHYHRSSDAVETPNYLDYTYATGVTAATAGYLVTMAGLIDVPEVLGTQIAGDQLVLDFADDRYGVAEIVVRATDSAGASVEDTFSVTVNSVPDVVGRHVFYNDSGFDGKDAAADARDDTAVAPDKTALLPGQTATFANYTGFTAGINGLMIDVEDLPGTPTAADFRFKVGNDDDPATWTAAPQPAAVAVRPGEGLEGSDRVTITWPDGSIRQQWLQVTVLATPATALARPDVFYYGNAVGESGNSTTDAKVNAFDMLGARDNVRDMLNPATIDFPFDYNRDARVNATDMLIARSNVTHMLSALKLITSPGVKAAAAESPSSRAVSFEELAWLPEFEPADGGQRPDQRRDPHHRAIDVWLPSGKP